MSLTQIHFFCKFRWLMHKYDLSNWQFLPLWTHLVTVSHIVQLKIVSKQFCLFIYLLHWPRWLAGWWKCWRDDRRRGSAPTVCTPPSTPPLAPPPTRPSPPAPAATGGCCDQAVGNRPTASLPLKSDTKQVILCEL